jgi:predicted PurR-regulated permease PerM
MPDMESVQARMTEGAAQASQFVAMQALNIGQNTLEFPVSLGVMLYLLFFLLRDAEALYARLRAAVPLRADRHLRRDRRRDVLVPRHPRRADSSPAPCGAA